MSDINGISNTNTASQSSSYQSLVGNYELFLTLLTTQVQNQDPLDPLDSAEYTNQLVQYSAVEQSIQTNDYLAQIMATMESSQASGYVSYLGTEVTAAGGTTMLSNGSANWAYSVTEEASGTFEIRDANGTPVYSGDVTLSPGGGNFTWDGETDAGGQARNGAYSIVFDVTDAAGNAEPVSIETTGVVDGLDLSTGTPFLRIGDVSVPVSAVRSVNAPS